MGSGGLGHSPKQGLGWMMPVGNVMPWSVVVGRRSTGTVWGGLPHGVDGRAVPVLVVALFYLHVDSLSAVHTLRMYTLYVDGNFQTPIARI